MSPNHQSKRLCHSWKHSLTHYSRGIRGRLQWASIVLRGTVSAERLSDRSGIGGAVRVSDSLGAVRKYLLYRGRIISLVVHRPLVFLRTPLGSPPSFPDALLRTLDSRTSLQAPTGSSSPVTLKQRPGLFGSGVQITRRVDSSSLFDLVSRCGRWVLASAEDPLLRFRSHQ